MLTVPNIELFFGYILTYISMKTGDDWVIRSCWISNEWNKRGFCVSIGAKNYRDRNAADELAIRK
jgi:hypothetical protein